jgi:hypothetical protein
MQKPRQRKCFKAILVLCCMSTIFYFGCKKLDTSQDLEKTNLTNSSNDFFKIPPNTSPLVNRIIENIRSRNNKKEFVNSFANNYGLPVWNKVLELGIKKKNNNLSSFGASNVTNSNDTIIFIPLVQYNQTFVNGFIKAVITDSINLSFSLAQDYKNYPFTTTNPEEVTADRFSSAMMYLDKLVFGEAEYKITDKRLFNNGTDYFDTANIERKITLTEQSVNTNSLLALICYTNTVWTITANWHCPKIAPCTTTSCDGCGAYCVDYSASSNNVLSCGYENIGGPTGGGPTGGGGGGSGPEIPHYYPCIPIANFSSNNVLPGDPLPPCPPPSGGTGYTPTPILNDPISPINDSIPRKLSRACNHQADSVFNWGLQNGNREQSFILVLKDGIVYAKNFQPGSLNGDKTRVNYTLAPGEQLLAYIHTHPLPTPLERSSFSADDFIELTKNRNIPGYTAILECGNVRYALVIEDLAKLNTFTSTRRNNVLRQGWDDAIYSQPNIYSNGPQACVNGIVQYLGSASVCGVGFYRATAPDKNNFVKLNP